MAARNPVIAWIAKASLTMKAEFLFSLFLSALLTACGSESDMPRPGPHSGVGLNKTFGQLTTTEMSLLCDWTAGCFGGYGHKMTCQGGSVTMGAAKSHDQCVAEWESETLPSTCASMTIAEFEGCVYNAECPMLWLDEQCSALRDCFLDMLSGSAGFREVPARLDLPAGWKAALSATGGMGPIRSLRPEDRTP
jgi:hypothetical protein